MRILALLLITLSFPAVAQVYKWTDENGVTHFGTQPPPGQQESVDIRKSSPGDMGSSLERKRTQNAQVEQAESQRHENARDEFRRVANQRACELAQTELESAERLLTLAESQSAYDFVLERRQKSVEHWKDRADLHCNDPG